MAGQLQLHITELATTCCESQSTLLWSVWTGSTSWKIDSFWPRLGDLAAILVLAFILRHMSILWHELHAVATCVLTFEKPGLLEHVRRAGRALRLSASGFLKALQPGTRRHKNPSGTWSNKRLQWLRESWKAKVSCENRGARLASIHSQVRSQMTTWELMKSLDLGRSRNWFTDLASRGLLQAENDQHIFACGNVRLVLALQVQNFSILYTTGCIQMRWQFGFSCVSFLINPKWPLWKALQPRVLVRLKLMGWRWFPETSLCGEKWGEVPAWQRLNSMFLVGGTDRHQRNRQWIWAGCWDWWRFKQIQEARQGVYRQ